MTARLRFLGVAGVELVSPGGVHVVVDPCLSGVSAIGVAPSPVELSELDATDAVLVSHGARDHYGDAPTIAQRSGATVGCAPDVRLRLLHDGVADAQIRKLLPGVHWRVDDVTVKALPACHISMHEVDGAWVSGPPLCFLIDVGGTKIFHAGDTALFGDLRMFGELHRPDVALLPIGATEAGVEFMPPEDAAIALDWLGARIVVPMHYPAGSGAEHVFTDAVRARGLDARIEALAPGSVLECA